MRFELSINTTRRFKSASRVTTAAFDRYYKDDFQIDAVRLRRQLGDDTLDMLLFVQTRDDDEHPSGRALRHLVGS
jgi:hypothetical protein